MPLTLTPPIPPTPLAPVLEENNACAAAMGSLTAPAPGKPAAALLIPRRVAMEAVPLPADPPDWLLPSTEMPLSEMVGECELRDADR